MDNYPAVIIITVFYLLLFLSTPYRHLNRFGLGSY